MKFSLEDLLASLRKLFGREQSVDNILKPITKITNRLEKHERVQTRESARRLEAAERARNAALAADAAARRAAEKRSKILDTFA
jgi:hypothetical protein